MPSAHDQLVEQALQSQKQLFIAMRAAAEPVWLDLDLTFAQIKGLMLLAHQGPLTISQIAEALKVGRPAASILVDRLVDVGLVERAEDTIDRRRTYARLSARAEELVARFRQVGPERLRDCLNRLSDDDLAGLVRGLRALVAQACPTTETKA